MFCFQEILLFIKIQLIPVLYLWKINNKGVNGTRLSLNYNNFDKQCFQICTGVRLHLHTKHCEFFFVELSDNLF